MSHISPVSYSVPWCAIASHGVQSAPHVPWCPGYPSVPRCPSVPSVPGVPQCPTVTRVSPSVPRCPMVSPVSHSVPWCPAYPSVSHGVPQCPMVSRVSSSVPRCPMVSPSVPRCPTVPHGVPGVPQCPTVTRVSHSVTDPGAEALLLCGATPQTSHTSITLEATAASNKVSSTTRTGPGDADTTMAGSRTVPGVPSSFGEAHCPSRGTG